MKAASASRRTFLAACTAVLAATTLRRPLFAQTTASQSDHGATPMNPPLKKYNVTIRRFNPNQGLVSGEDFILPVDSPDPEHAVASTMSNAISFTTKTSGGSLLPVAFTCTAIAERN